LRFFILRATAGSVKAASLSKGLRRTMKRQWLYAVVALAGGVLGGFIGGKLSSLAAASIRPTADKIVTAQQLLLVDAKGNTRGELRLNQKGDPGLSLYDHSGKLRANLEVATDADWGFKFFNGSGTVRLAITITPDGITALRLFDSHGHPRALLGIDAEGEPGMDFYSEQGKLLRELP